MAVWTRGCFYDSPYTDFSPRGVDGVFESKEVDELVSVLEDVKRERSDKHDPQSRFGVKFGAALV